MVKYYYIDDITKQQQGPVPLSELENKNIRPETMVWRSGMGDWVRADSVDDLAFLFNSKAVNPQGSGSVSSPVQTFPQNSFSTSNNQNHAKFSEVKPMLKNWMLESILLSILCCSPVSVVGIFFASRVENLYYADEYDKAVKAATNARNWALAGMLFIPACYTLFYLFMRITSITF